MNLSKIITGVPEYIEFAWRCAPNAAAQSLPSNAETTLTLDTEIIDTGDLVTAPTTNQFTLPSGTYYFEASCPIYSSIGDGANVVLILATSAGTHIVSGHSGSRNTPFVATLNGQFAVSSSTAFVLKAMPNNQSAGTEVSGREYQDYVGDINFSNATPLVQRTTIKLWKLK